MVYESVLVGKWAQISQWEAELKIGAHRFGRVYKTRAKGHPYSSEFSFTHRGNEKHSTLEFAVGRINEEATIWIKSLDGGLKLFIDGLHPQTELNL